MTHLELNSPTTERRSTDESRSRRDAEEQRRRETERVTMQVWAEGLGQEGAGFAGHSFEPIEQSGGCGQDAESLRLCGPLRLCVNPMALLMSLGAQKEARTSIASVHRPHQQVAASPGRGWQCGGTAHLLIPSG